MCIRDRAGRGRELVAELHRGQRVEAQLLERAARVHLGAGSVTEHGGDVGADDLQHLGRPLGLGQRGEPAREPGDGGLVGRARLAAHRVADQTAPEPRHGAVTRAQRAERHPHRQQQVATGGQRGVEQGQALGVGQRAETTARQAVLAAGAHRAGHAARPLPQAPGQRDGGLAVRAAVRGQGVEERVRGGVVALAGRAEHTGGGGERDEQRQVVVGGEVVQVPGGVDLGPQHRVDPFRRQGGQHTVVQHARRVHHAGERALGADVGQQGGQRVAVGGVAGGDPGVGAQDGQLGQQVRRAFGGGAAAGGQHQVPHAVLRDEVLGHERAQSPGTAGDQDRAVDGGQVHRPGGLGQPRCQHDAVADDDLGLVGGERDVQGRLGGGQAVGVDEQDPAGVLRLRGADQAAGRGGGQVGHVLAGRDGHGPGRDQHQALVARSRTECVVEWTASTPSPPRTGMTTASSAPSVSLVPSATGTQVSANRESGAAERTAVSWSVEIARSTSDSTDATG